MSRFSREFVRRLGLVGLCALISGAAVLVVLWMHSEPEDAELPGEEAQAKQDRRGELPAGPTAPARGAETAPGAGRLRGEERESGGPATATPAPAMAGESGNQVDGGEAGAEVPTKPAERSESLSQEEQTRQTIRCRIHGNVSRAGRPVAGVTILLHDRYEPGAFTRIKSDAQGKFNFNDLRYGVWAVSARLRRSWAKGVAVHCDAQDKDVEVRLALEDADVHVTGLVSDKKGKPLSGAILDVGYQNLPTDKGKHSVLPVDQDGRYDIWVSDAEPNLCITARAPGHQSLIKTVPPNRSEVGLDFQLVHNTVARGEVLGPAGPAAGVKVAAGFERPDGSGFLISNKTDARGRFALEIGTPQITLSAWSPELGWAYTTLPPCAEDEKREFTVLKLQPGRQISGTIRLKDGSRVALGEILFSCRTASISSRWQADSQGDFVIPNLPPDLPVSISPWHDRRPFEERYTTVPPDRSTVEVVLYPQED